MRFIATAAEEDDDDEEDDGDSDASDSEVENDNEDTDAKNNEEEGFGLKSLLEEDANKQSQVNDYIWIQRQRRPLHEKSLCLASSICCESSPCMPLMPIKVRCCA